MKTLATLNWVLIGLYGLVILYLILANDSPNNDAAGRGMMSGFIFVLLLFVGGLVFLNLRTARAARITAAVLGGVPLVLVSTNLMVEAKAAIKREQYVSEEKAIPVPPVNEADAAKQTVLNFLGWYKNNFPYISQISLVDQQSGKTYAVNTISAERYLTYLNSSEMLTEHFINEWRIYFTERNVGFQLTHQHEGTPTGFEYDIVMLSQEVATQMASLKNLKVNSVTVRQNQATVQFTLLDDYEFRLVKRHNRWFINEILNLSAE